MSTSKISSGVVHKVPADLETAIVSSSKVREVWEDITPLARNEWICWVISPKKQETRDKHIKILSEKLKAGKRRPCCWIGCQHREK